MLLSVLVIIAVAAITFFHYVQGFFSATISAILAIVAAVMAVSFHQPLVELLGQWRFADQSHALALIVLFAAIYLVLRLVFDALLPGNVRLPAAVDKAGGAAMGVVAGVFAVGVVVVAAQALPFYPGIAGYARYEIIDNRHAVVPPARSGQRAMDSEVIHEMREDGFSPQRLQRLILPVDDIVIGMTAYLSDNGALAGRRAMPDVHPDYLQELFAQRLGVQVGAHRTAINVEGRQDVSVEGVYRLDSIMAGDAELSEIRQDPPALIGTAEQPVRITPLEEQVMVVVRTNVASEAADDGRLFRFSPASVRLVYNRENYHPVGTLENARFLFVNRVDDPLIAQGGRAIDLVFRLPREVVREAAGEQAEPAIARGVFMEVKRLARVDLSGRAVQPRIEPSENVEVLRKPGVRSRFAGQIGRAPVRRTEPEQEDLDQPEQPEDDPGAAGPQPYESRRLGYTLEYPEGWGLEEIDDETVELYPPADASDAGFRPRLTIVLSVRPATAPTLEQYVRFHERELTQQMPQGSTMSSQPMTLSGQEAWRLEYSGMGDAEQLRLTTIFVGRGRDVFTLSLATAADEHERFRPAAEGVFNTFRLLP